MTPDKSREQCSEDANIVRTIEPARLIDWMARFDVDKKALAVALHVTVRCIEQWLSGKRACPYHVGLALNWLEKHPERLGKDVVKPAVAAGPVRIERQPVTKESQTRRAKSS